MVFKTIKNWNNDSNMVRHHGVKSNAYFSPEGSNVFQTIALEVTKDKSKVPDDFSSS